ncbi:MAG: DUF3168 domain-containing protein [Bacteroides sp.]
MKKRYYELTAGDDSYMNKFKATNGIRTILLNNKKINGLVGDNIFPLIAKEGTVGDFIIYQRDSYEKEYTKMGICEEKCNVHIDIVSDDYDRSQELACLVNETLEGEFNNPKIVVKLLDSTEDFSDGKYIQVLLFSIE